jgi:hypothetical protein
VFEKPLCSLVIVGVGVGAAGCPLAPLCEEKTPAVDPLGWVFVDNADDVLWPAPAEAATCTAEEIQVQSFGADDAVEIDTRFGCGWATVSQPLLQDLRAGDDVQVRVFYFSQASFPESQAEVAVALDGEVVMSELIDIPTSSGLLAPRITLTRDVASGSLAHFHIGNHGDNSWNLIELSLISEGPCPE